MTFTYSVYDRVQQQHVKTAVTRKSRGSFFDAQRRCTRGHLRRYCCLLYVAQDTPVVGILKRLLTNTRDTQQKDMYDIVVRLIMATAVARIGWPCYLFSYPAAESQPSSAVRGSAFFKDKTNTGAFHSKPTAILGTSK